MKKSLLALAALTAFAGAASAQSSVTLYGRVDLSIGKGIGVDSKSLGNGSGSRLGLRGSEDLGGGLSAIFNIEHRFDADTGAGQGITTRMWGARSLVGLKGGFGQVVLGREYSTAFLGNQLGADPWGWDTVVNGTLDAPAGRGLNSSITGGAIAKVRYDNSITYNVAAGGFSFGIQTAEQSAPAMDSRPLNFAVGYAAGPLRATFGYEKTGDAGTDTEKWMSFNLQYNLGFMKVGGFYGTGNTETGNDHRSYMLTATAPMGAGEFRFSYGKLTNKTADVDAAKGFGVGYHYSMSKRTTLYADLVRNTGALVGGSNETGYDVGIKHNF
ncbi:MAG: porin [Burkholderiaceae bacterium]|nr:porin [Burkholderiaceae bacterium]